MNNVKCHCPLGTILKVKTRKLYAEGMPNNRVYPGDVCMVLDININKSAIHLTFLHSSGMVGMIPWYGGTNCFSDWFEVLS